VKIKNLPLTANVVQKAYFNFLSTRNFGFNGQGGKKTVACGRIFRPRGKKNGGAGTSKFLPQAAFFTTDAGEM
jgi:hypothetical protein